MFTKKVAAAMATAALASAALAAPALATTDPVLIDTPGHTFSFGDQCAPGAAPGASGTLDWRDNAAVPPTIAPHLEGYLCLQGTQARTRMHVVYHNDSHQDVTAFSSVPATGNGGPLNAFYVNTGGSRVSSVVVTHALIDIERWDAANLEWDLVARSVQYF